MGERGAVDAALVRRVVRGVLVLVALWIVLGVLWVGWAVHAADAGRDRLVSARDLSAEDLLVGRGTDEVLAAQADFSRASSRASSPVVAPLRLLPGVGRQVESIEAITAAAADVSGVAAGALEEASSELNGAVPTGEGRVALLEDLADVAERASAQVAVADLGPATGLLGPVRDARTDLADELRSLEVTMLNVRDASQGMAEVFEGPSQYLLLAANNAEMRAGSGMFLSVGVLSFDGGELSVDEMVPSGELTLEEGVPYTDVDLEERWSWAFPDREWRNLAMSPRFPAFAEMASRMWVARGGEQVDGVLAVDPVALRGLLGAIGPLEVDGEQVDEENVVTLLLHDQYLALEEDDTGDAQDERRELLSEVAEAVVAQLDQTTPDLGALAEGVRGAAAGRHLMLWSADPTLQRVWGEVGAGGVVGADDLYLSVDSYGRNKLDQFLQVEAVLETELVDDGTDVVVQATLRNVVPDGEPDYIAGEQPTEDKPAGTYAGLLTLTMPGLAELDPEPRFTVYGPDGESQVVAFDVVVPQGEQVSVEVAFHLPAGVRAFDVGPSARVPPISWRAGELVWFDDQLPRVRVEW